MRQLLLTFPVLLVLLSSGCTGTDFCIPGLTCSQIVEETHDVIVIESLQALPNNVPPDGTIRLVAIVSNVADVNAEIKEVPVYVELYDFCQGLFNLDPKTQVQQKNLLRGQKEQVEWTLTALPRTSVPVKTECTLKIRARYPYATKSITTLHLIDYAEMQRRINEGTFKEAGSYISTGYGPIKPYITVEGTQPIPVSSEGGDTNTINAVLSFQIKNKGRGFLSTPYCSGTGCDQYKCYTLKDKKGDAGPVIFRNQVMVTAAAKDTTSQTIAGIFHKDSDNKLDEFFSNTCESGGREGSYIKLIKKESTPMPVPLVNKGIGNVPVESTKTIQASIGFDDKGEFNPDSEFPYWYEFRKEIKVTVEPKF